MNKHVTMRCIHIRGIWYVAHIFTDSNGKRRILTGSLPPN